MRIGINPKKNAKIQTKWAYHHVVIPVFIPSEDDYYKDAFTILKICLESLYQTIHQKTKITVINNASTAKVQYYLRSQLACGNIYRLIEYAENQGKVDPVINILKGSLESLVTVSDCDVLFIAGWQQEVEKIFVNFPHVGVVSPMPQPDLLNYFTTWSWYYGFLTRSIKQIECRDTESIIKFKLSIGRPIALSEFEKKPFAIERNNVEAIIGAGHFCVTYNRNVFKFIPEGSSGAEFDGAEKMFLDKPVFDGGFLSLATIKGWVFHMGNTPEKWMYEVLQGNSNFISSFTEGIFVQNGIKFKLNVFKKIIVKLLRSNKRKYKFFRMINRLKK